MDSGLHIEEPCRKALTLSTAGPQEDNMAGRAPRVAEPEGEPPRYPTQPPAGSPPSPPGPALGQLAGHSFGHVGHAAQPIRVNRQLVPWRQSQLNRQASVGLSRVSVSRDHS